jgi:hypothetical protein
MAAAQSFGAGLSPPNAAVSICSHTFAQASLSLAVAASSKSLSSPTKKMFLTSKFHLVSCFMMHLFLGTHR